MKFGLKAKFILFVSLLLSAFSVAFTVINIQARQDGLHRQLEEKAKALASLLSASAADPSYLLQIEDLKLLLKDVLDQEDILYVQVWDEKGHMVTDGSQENSHRFEGLNDPINLSAVAAEALVLQFGTDVLDVAKPVFVNNRRIGGVRIGFSLDQLHQDIADVRNRNILLGVGVTLIGVVLTFVLVMVVIRPLGLLVEGTRAVSGGDLDYQIKVGTQDELHFLASSFNAMTRNLRQAQDVLEHRVDERTTELAEANVLLEREVAERRRIEDDLVRVQRLRVATELSAGVSHNLNNLLTGILTPAEMLQELVKDPKLRKYVDMICTSAHRTKDLVHRLHQYTQGIQDDRPQRVLPNDIVQEVIEAARPRWQDESASVGIVIDVETKLSDVSPIRATEAGLHNVLLNLILNAVDAMPLGGTITLETRETSGTVRFVVQDTGVGMNDETRKRVFEPFFTTKATVGTGLGLATVFGTITGWGGSIDVESGQGKGTTFVFDLPVWVEDLLEPMVIPEKIDVRSGKVLMVEDNDIVIQMTQALMADKHHLDVVVDGATALHRFKPHVYDVALIDLGLPGTMPGNQVAEKMKALDPHIVTVLITGWELTGRDARLVPFDFYIQKPVGAPEQLLNVITQAINLHDERVGKR